MIAPKSPRELHTPDPEGALEGVRAFHAEIDASAAPKFAALSGKLQCKRGCSSCCLDDLSVYEVEAERIRRDHPELLAKGEPRAPGACAFLDAGGACRIYESRPRVCRVHGLPLAKVEEKDGEFVETRSICELNEPGLDLLELPMDLTWRVGLKEKKLVALQEQFSGGPRRRVALRSLFAREWSGGEGT